MVLSIMFQGSRGGMKLHGGQSLRQARYYASNTTKATSSGVSGVLDEQRAILKKDTAMIDGQEGKREKKDDDSALVVFFGWMGSKKKHLKKYGELYNKKREMKHKHIIPSPRDVLQPSFSMKNLEKLLDDIATNHADKKLFFHGFSTGGYKYGNMIRVLESNKHLREAIVPRIVGQVFDSPVDYHSVPSILPDVVFAKSHPVKRKLARMASDAFFTLTPTMENLKVSSESYHNNPITSPALWFYSQDDPIALAKDVEIVYSKWASRGTQNFVMKWDKSKHVSHYMVHRDEYEHALHQFIDVCLNKGKHQVRVLRDSDHSNIERVENLSMAM
eukprot:Nk52_evm111s485 gene=Nk52_evmTU111s485